MTRFKILLLALCSTTIVAAPALAQTWTEYKSESGIFIARFPDKSKSQSTQMLIADKRAVRSEEVTASVDQRPYKNVVKSYVIKYDQSIGPQLTKEEIDRLLDYEFRKFEAFYAPMDGVVYSSSKNYYLGFPGGEIMIGYRDPTFGVQSLRVRIFYTLGTRFQQIVFGPEDVMNAMPTKSYYDYLSVDDGVTVVDQTLNTTYKTMTSPTGMFSLVFPPELAPPYYTAEPAAKWDDNVENVTMSFSDPVRNEKIFFNYYGYILDEDANFDTALEILMNKHIKPKRANTKDVAISKSVDEKNKYAVIQTEYAINPPKDFPYLTRVKQRLMFSGKSLMVQEVMTSPTLMKSDVTAGVYDRVKFNPYQVHAAAEPVITEPEKPEATPDTPPANPLPREVPKTGPTEAPSVQPATPAPPSAPAAQ